SEHIDLWDQLYINLDRDQRVLKTDQNTPRRTNTIPRSKFMRHATANGKRIVSVMTGLAQKSGDSATFTGRIFCAKRYLRLGFFLGSLGLISILLLSV